MEKFYKDANSKNVEYYKLYAKPLYPGETFDNRLFIDSNYITVATSEDLEIAAKNNCAIAFRGDIFYSPSVRCVITPVYPPEHIFVFTIYINGQYISFFNNEDLQNSYGAPVVNDEYHPRTDVIDRDIVYGRDTEVLYLGEDGYLYKDYSNNIKATPDEVNNILKKNGYVNSPQSINPTYFPIYIESGVFDQNPGTILGHEVPENFERPMYTAVMLMRSENGLLNEGHDDEIIKAVSEIVDFNSRSMTRSIHIGPNVTKNGYAQITFDPVSSMYQYSFGNNTTTEETENISDEEQNR